MTLVPTMSLRFIIRDVSDGVDADGDDYWTQEKALQQMFETPAGEQVWRDVPVIFDAGQVEPKRTP